MANLSQRVVSLAFSFQTAKFARFYELREANERRGRVNGRRRIPRSLAKILLIGPITPIVVNDTDNGRF